MSGKWAEPKFKLVFDDVLKQKAQKGQIPILMYQDRVVAVADLFVDQAFNGQDCELIWRR